MNHISHHLYSYTYPESCRKITAFTRHSSPNKTMGNREGNICIEAGGEI
jgi:hypothetical protein